MNSITPDTKATQQHQQLSSAELTWKIGFSAAMAKTAIVEESERGEKRYQNREAVHFNQ